MIETLYIILRKITIITLYIAIVSFFLSIFWVVEYIKIAFYHLNLSLYIFWWFFLSDLTIKLLLVSIIFDLIITIFILIRKFI